MIGDKKIGFIGAGAMAEAIISGIISAGVIKSDQIFITNRKNQERLDQICRTYGIPAENKNAHHVRQADIVIIAVKPKDIDLVLQIWGAHFFAEQLVISVAAGIPVTYFEKKIDRVAFIRAMPNTASHVRLSATAICGGTLANSRDLDLAHRIFCAIGKVLVVKEELMDAVTGLSGSGPAYFFYMIESLEQAGIEAGLSRDVAKELILQTFMGAAQMLYMSQKEASQLRQEVTSPGGTTMAGLEMLNRYDMKEAMIQAVLHATNRSKEIEKLYASECKTEE
ncbi:pyrroline-5-carboxylate reductase [Hazenella sp. IB182357]|uniref:Pyrroline-5-carboxylate reductase n=1 Tax=Polycladospora coralii TaxID=2771432 RepID=A0A926N7I8_9BACL|nr:pyrroline-5-carboxylate reductase [Polycladospora coralii]MBD1373376.1 pyrroline-5-carboxylate reductase [Polycladospora coralii]